MSETFVDVKCRGVELGRRVHLSEIGPTGAYLEHPQPMPVGSELRVVTDDGVELGVVVVRVCEQVASAERPPGMFVRVVELSGRAESWWAERKSVDVDPAFPEPARDVPIAQRPTLRMDPSEIAEVTHEGLQRPAALDAPETEVIEPDTEPEPDSAGSNGAGSTLQGISAAAALAAAEADGRSSGDVATTVKLTPDQVKAITDTADEDSSTSNGESDGKSKRRKRRRKKKKI